MVLLSFAVSSFFPTGVGINTGVVRLPLGEGVNAGCPGIDAKACAVLVADAGTVIRSPDEAGGTAWTVVSGLW
jgi:hypothetical protein